MKVNVVDFENFNMKKFSLEEPKSQTCENKYCYPKYDYDGRDENVIFVTDEIFMDKGCIPMYNKEYHPLGRNDIKRSYFYIYKDENNAEMFEWIKKIDRRYKKIAYKIVSGVEEDVYTEDDDLYRPMISKNKEGEETIKIYLHSYKLG